MKIDSAKLVLTVALAGALASCGGGDSSSASGSNGAIAGGTTNPTPTPTATATPAPTSTPTPTPSPTESGGPAQTTQDAMNAVMLRTHNEARAEVGVAAATLDPDLSRQALEYAEEMARTGNFAHSSSSQRPNQGENLWAGTENAFAYERMSGAWIDEKQYYIHDRFPYVSNTGRWQDVGHYTQIIWEDSTRLGCGIASGQSRDWLVCRYGPPGNVSGQFAYE